MRLLHRVEAVDSDLSIDLFRFSIPLYHLNLLRSGLIIQALDVASKRAEFIVDSFVSSFDLADIANM